jgi:urease subunit alpha
MFAGGGRLAARRSVVFTAPESDVSALGLEADVVAIKDTRALTKADMPLNDARPDIRVEPDTFRVWVDGEEITPAPAAELPLAQRYELF